MRKLKMEVHLVVLGDRTHVLLCEVLRRDSKKMILRRNEDPTAVTIEVDAAEDNVPLDHDMCPPKVNITTSHNDRYGKLVVVKSTGFLYDLSVLSDVLKMIIIEDGGSHKKVK